MSPESVRQVVNMVLTDNKGQVLTEALCIGVEKSIVHYVGALVAAEQTMVEGAKNALD